MPTSTQPELETARRLGAAIGRLSRRLRPTEASREAGLTPARISALLYVDRNGPVRLSELVVSEGLNPTMLSRMVADLVEAGLFERSCDPVDRRSAWVAVTEAGHALAVRMRRQRSEAVERALSGLSAEDREAITSALPALEALGAQLPMVRS